MQLLDFFEHGHVQIEYGRIHSVTNGSVFRQSTSSSPCNEHSPGGEFLGYCSALLSSGPTTVRFVSVAGFARTAPLFVLQYLMSCH